MIQIIKHLLYYVCCSSLGVEENHDFNLRLMSCYVCSVILISDFGPE